MRDDCEECGGTGMVMADRRATHGYIRPETCGCCFQPPPVTVTTTHPENSMFPPGTKLKVLRWPTL